MMTGIMGQIDWLNSGFVLLGFAVVALLADLFLKKQWPKAAFQLSCLGLLITMVIGFSPFGDYGRLMFHGLIANDDMSRLMNAAICLTVFLTFVYSRHYIDERHIPSGEYYVLGMLATIGMTTLVSAHSLLTIYLGLELVSLPLYALTAIRRFDGNCSEASVKYLVMGAIASGMLLFGMSLMYAATGVLDLYALSQRIAEIAPNERLLMNFGLVFIVAGVGFKMAAVPFHMWAPDVYTGAPTSVTMLIGAAPKIAAVGMALRLLTMGLADLSAQWQPMILMMALLSTGLGNLLAVVQTNIKRLLAYSAISHMGYVLLGLVALSVGGYSAAIYYVMMYAMMSMGAFGLMVLISSTGEDIEKVYDLKGLHQRSPWLALMMMIVLFAMAGVPPTVGFLAKFWVLQALVDVHMVWVAILGLIFAVIGAYYYLSIVKVMYFDEAVNNTPIVLPKFVLGVFSLNCLALLYWGIFPSSLMNACTMVLSG